jgi:hypothetical protein
MDIREKALAKVAYTTLDIGQTSFSCGRRIGRYLFIDPLVLIRNTEPQRNARGLKTYVIFISLIRKIL